MIINRSAPEASWKYESKNEEMSTRNDPKTFWSSKKFDNKRPIEKSTEFQMMS